MKAGAYLDRSGEAERLWVDVCRRATATITEELQLMPTRKEREPRIGYGQGGDATTAVDDAAERAVLSVLETLAAEGVSFTVLSEEVGEQVYGDAPEGLLIIVDPIDGSNNAKRTVPFFSLSIAVADGGTMNDVFFGFVHDFGTGEEFTARRGAGARLNGQLLDGPSPKDPIEILSLEATATTSVSRIVGDLVGQATRIRIPGSLALSLCYLAAGRYDAVISLKPARSVDIAAAQLLVRERGITIQLPEDEPFGRAVLDLEGRSRVVAASSPDRCAELFGALSASLPLERVKRS